MKFSSYILYQRKIKIKITFTTEVKWNIMKNAIHDAANNTLKKNTPESKKPWINNNIIRGIEKIRKYGDA